MTTPVSVIEINRMDRAMFVDRFGSIYEHNGWVAEQAWENRPFKDREMLATVMRKAVRCAGREKQLELLRNHPRLGILAGLTDLSSSEQANAGVKSASEKERIELAKLNDAYESKFGFPFVVAVKGLNVREIIDACRARLERDADTEFEEGLNQVFRIAGFRIADAIDAEA
ncbi:MAG: 2-oxo-4-hydroxy-4-carboxy-5-ureidoimidazoline decarboxylase [Gammaproteobacteria bacterium]